MITAKVFQSGRSQAVRLPKKYRFKTSEIRVTRTADGLLLTEKDPWDIFADGVAELSDDFLKPRQQPTLEERDF
ncbi:MAG: type II toxin-antitoxin system VapB family antitoxin [Lentisphaeria bacterium]|nr:type II toxin-antitoxin system VapB family antitoxin [Lentisphaeria bacterium]